MDSFEHASLAVRHRPRRFADVVGQRHVKVPLQRAVAAGNVPKQTLFSGGSGLGKTTVARIFAAAVLCEADADHRTPGDSCASCTTCRDIHAGTHPDVIEIDAASNGRVDEIREIAARAHLTPLRGTFRVYIIDEAHGLSQAGGQAFLKLLEEPPPHVLFMLATTDPERMLHTNRSRCVQFELLPPTAEEVVSHVVEVAAREGAVVDAATAWEIVNASPAELGLRGVLMTLEKVLPVLRADGASSVAVAEVLGRPTGADLDQLVAALAAADLAKVFTALDTLQARHPIAQVLEQISSRLEAHIIDAVAHHAPMESLRAKITASDIVLEARRDGSRLAALVAFTKIAALADPDIAGVPAPVVAAPDEPEVQRVAATPRDSTDTPVDTAHTTDTSPEQMPEPEEYAVSAVDEPLEDITSEEPVSIPPTPTIVDDTGYVSDPFTPSAASASPTAQSPAGDSNAAEAHTTLLAAVAATESRRSRIAAAALRPAHASFRDGVLWLTLPAGSVRALEADTALVAAAAERSGLQVQLEAAAK